MQRVSRLYEGVDHGTHTLVVLAEDGLEDCEVEMSHLENDLIKYVQVLGSLRVLVNIK